MIQLSANLGFMWPDRPLLDRIAAAGTAGFKAVELHWPYDTPASDVRRALDAAGLKLLGLNTSVGDAHRGDFGLAALPGRERDFDSSFAQALEYCLAAGGTSIHVMAGVEEDTPQTEAILLRNVRDSAQRAAARGITILLEAINPRDKPGYFYSRVERAADIIVASGESNVRLMFDAYHVGVGQGDIIRRLGLLFPLIGHIQIAAVPSRAEPDEGEINYPVVFDAIEHLNYAGWVGCEYKPRADTERGLVWRERLGRNRFS